MAIIDVVKWDAAAGVYAWKFPSSELSSWTQLIVSESQEALMLKEGQALGPFTAGRHVLSSDNYPVLNTLLKIPFGRSPYTAEVWFVQRTFNLNIKWGTSDPIQVEDPLYHIMLPVRAFGQYGLTVQDTKRFLVKLVGTLPAFTEKTLTEYFKGIIITRSKDIIAKYLVKSKISILHISAHLNEISEALQAQISKEIEEYGLRVVNFNVNSISTNDADPAVQKLKKALADKAEMDILGFNYHQKRSFDTMEAAASNTGAGASVMGAGIGMGLGMGMGVPMGNAAAQMGSTLNTTTPDTPKSKGAACDKCGHVSPVGTKFCPECGDIFYLCPSCGADNPTDAIVCIKCGEGMPTKCPGCSATISRKLKFCSECGKPLSSKCPDCNESNPLGTKFCGNCGKPL